MLITLLIALGITACGKSGGLPNDPGEAEAELSRLLPGGSSVERATHVLDSLAFDVRPYHEASGHLVGFVEVRNWNPIVTADNRADLMFEGGKLVSVRVKRVYTSF